MGVHSVAGVRYKFEEENPKCTINADLCSGGPLDLLSAACLGFDQSFYRLFRTEMPQGFRS